MGIIGVNTGTGSTIAVSMAADTKRASKFTASETFTATRMGIEIDLLFAGSDKIRLGIYDDVSGSPTNLLGYTGEISARSTGTGARWWYHADLLSGVSITNGNDYWLAVIASGACGVYKVAGTSEYDTSDVFSDGFSDPFGSSTSESYKLSIYAADSDDYFITVGTDNALQLGGWVGETSGGTKYCVILRDQSYGIQIYKNIDTLPECVGTDNVSTIGGGTIGYIDAAIDSDDKIHVICAPAVESGNDVTYRIFDTDTDAWEGSWEEVLDYTQQAPSHPGVAISIDSNDKPHVLVVDNVKDGGTSLDNVYYTEKTGASWATPVQIGDRDVKTHTYWHPELTVRNSDYIETWYYGYSDPPAAYVQHWKVKDGGGWGSENDSAYGQDNCRTVVVATSGGTVYRYQVDSSSNNLYENDVDTGYDSVNIDENIAAVLDGTDRYLLYIDTNNDVHLISNDGGGWTDEGVLQSGSYDCMIAGWSYNALNNTASIDYLYDNGVTIYWDEYSLAAAASNPPRVRPLRFWRGVR